MYNFLLFNAMLLRYMLWPFVHLSVPSQCPGKRQTSKHISSSHKQYCTIIQGY